MSVGGECQTGRVPDGESVRVAIPESQFPSRNARCPMPDSRFPMPDANFLLLVNAIEQPKSPENPDKVGNCGMSICEYHKYI